MDNKPVLKKATVTKIMAGTGRLSSKKDLNII